MQDTIFWYRNTQKAKRGFSRTRVLLDFLTQTPTFTSKLLMQ